MSMKHFVVCAVALGAAGCGGESGGARDGSMDAARADASRDGARSPDASRDGMAVADGGDAGTEPTDAGPDAYDPTAPTDCVRQTVVIGRAPTSSCGFDLPVPVDTWLINIIIALRVGADGRVVCRVGGSGSCSPSGGWFMTSDTGVALCDESCLAFEGLGAEAVVVAELGCASSFCRDACRMYGETCSGGDSCCPGYECDPMTSLCVPCHGVGASCSTDDDRRLCCSNFCGEGGQCCYDVNDPCRVDADCCEGTCERGFCRCPAPEELCGSTCIDVTTDDANCGMCGNACGGGAACAAGACVCGGTQLYCGRACIDPRTDPANCGACGTRCRSDQVCRGRSCACAVGEVECGGVCTDLQTDRLHCGDCTTACSSLHVCSGGGCVCRPGLMLCAGMCVNTNTSNDHCGGCDMPCMGRRRCVSGVCA